MEPPSISLVITDDYGVSTDVSLLESDMCMGYPMLGHRRSKRRRSRHRKNVATRLNQKWSSVKSDVEYEPKDQEAEECRLVANDSIDNKDFNKATEAVCEERAEARGQSCALDLHLCTAGSSSSRIKENEDDEKRRLPRALYDNVGQDVFLNVTTKEAKDQKRIDPAPIPSRRGDHDTAKGQPAIQTIRNGNVATAISRSDSSSPSPSNTFSFHSIPGQSSLKFTPSSFHHCSSQSFTQQHETPDRKVARSNWDLNHRWPLLVPINFLVSCASNIQDETPLISENPKFYKSRSASLDCNVMNTLSNTRSDNQLINGDAKQEDGDSLAGIGRRFMRPPSASHSANSSLSVLWGRKRSQSLQHGSDDEAASVVANLLPSEAYKQRRHMMGNHLQSPYVNHRQASSLMNVNEETPTSSNPTYYGAPGLPIALAIPGGSAAAIRAGRRRSSAFITHNISANALSAAGCPCAKALTASVNAVPSYLTTTPCTKRCCVARMSIGSFYGSTDLLTADDVHKFNDWECGTETPPQEAAPWIFMEEYENVTLMYAKHEKIPMKDFGSEIRATMDIDHLLNKAVVLLDLPETSLEEIFSKIIHEMDIQEPEFTSEQVKNALFTQDAGNQFHILSRTVQSICTTNLAGGTFDYDQTWICALCMLPTVSHRHVAIARLSHPTNLGRTMQDLRFIVIVIAPSRAKGTKTALETARTFATLFADLDIRQRLVMAQGVDSFRHTMLQAAKELAVEQNQWRERKFSLHLSDAKEQLVGPTRWFIGRGILEDVRRRIPHYISDYTDGVRGPKTMQKLLSTVVFLYFACLLPSIALGVLNDDNTKQKMGVKKAIFGQAFGGLFFAIFGGQPMIILLTTVPLAIYVKIIDRIAVDYQLDFFALYACVGLWAQFFLILYANTELSNIMRFATRSTEEIFSLFISLAFIVEAFRALHESFKKCYKSGAGDTDCNKTCFNITPDYEIALNLTQKIHACHRENSLLYILLMAGTLWLALFLYNFRKTPFLTRAKREILADYAMPVAVIVMSCTGAYCFRDIDIEHFRYSHTEPVFKIAEVWRLPPLAILSSMILGFCLSLLFFIDQNLTSAIVNNQQNKLRKGSATHFDLFSVAILNVFLSLFGLPWMHAALPHSPLHLRALADVEERASQGHVLEVITNVRETRLASIIANSLILLSAFTMLPTPLKFIPKSVLDGLFLYMAVTSVNGNEMFERVLLLLTEQAAYPPTHYIRRVPQRKIHLFTCCQIIQLVLVCAVGFYPLAYVEMVFPIVVFCFLPIRHILIPKMIDYKFLDALDGRH